jgi:hypothetical protein
MGAYPSMKDHRHQPSRRAVNHQGGARYDRCYRVVEVAATRQTERFSILEPPPDSLHDSWRSIEHITVHPGQPILHSGWGRGERLSR